MGFWAKLFSATPKTREYWESKHPAIEQTYKGRPLPDGSGTAEFDVRRFVWSRDLFLDRLVADLKLKTLPINDAIQRIQQWVVQNIEYTDDGTLGSSEFWLFPSETLQRKRGDCEDGGCLISSLILAILPPEEHWRVRVAAGWVKPTPSAPEGGHGYCTFCRFEDNEWVVIDWCYFEDANTPIPQKPIVKDNPRYKAVWFSFNHEKAWSHVNFAMGGRAKNVRPDDFVVVKGS